MSFNHPLRHKDYTHSGFSRGHLVPYFISGGDRDQGGIFAAQGDKDDAQIVFEVNYMSNVTPQHHQCFNGGRGVWYKLETFIPRSS